MSKPRIVERPAFQVVGKKTWISGQDNALFGRFWDRCRAEGMYAFMEWLPNSDYVHANAPEMEVYAPGSDGGSENNYCEFWLPIVDK